MLRKGLVIPARGSQSLHPRHEGAFQSQRRADAGRDRRETGLAASTAWYEAADERRERDVPADEGL